ncbi:MAG: PilN domain-containing protein, partial [Deltaproteobacteria bacterium]|nr:PilN domain-containing protein [Deltaproteobacteria bacterium]
MIKIKINLATRSYTGTGVGIALPVAIIILSAILFVYLREQGRDYKIAAERLEMRVAELSERQSLKNETSKDKQESDADLAVVGDILGKRRFSWIEALDNLEKGIPSGISLSSIHPSFKDGGVSLAGSARDFAALSRFIDNLERLKVYRRVFLVNQSVREMDNGKTAIIF